MYIFVVILLYVEAVCLWRESRAGDNIPRACRLSLGIHPLFPGLTSHFFGASELETPVVQQMDKTPTPAARSPHHCAARDEIFRSNSRLDVLFTASPSEVDQQDNPQEDNPQNNPQDDCYEVDSTLVHNAALPSRTDVAPAPTAATVRNMDHKTQLYPQVIIPTITSKFEQKFVPPRFFTPLTSRERVNTAKLVLKMCQLHAEALKALKRYAVDVVAVDLELMHDASGVSLLNPDRLYNKLAPEIRGRMREGGDFKLPEIPHGETFCQNVLPVGEITGVIPVETPIKKSSTAHTNGGNTNLFRTKSTPKSRSGAETGRSSVHARKRWEMRRTVDQEIYADRFMMSPANTAEEALLDTAENTDDLGLSEEDQELLLHGFVESLSVFGELLNEQRRALENMRTFRQLVWQDRDPFKGAKEKGYHMKKRENRFPLEDYTESKTDEGKHVLYREIFGKAVHRELVTFMERHDIPVLQTRLDWISDWNTDKLKEDCVLADLSARLMRCNLSAGCDADDEDNCDVPNPFLQSVGQTPVVPSIRGMKTSLGNMMTSSESPRGMRKRLRFDKKSHRCMHSRRITCRNCSGEAWVPSPRSQGHKNESENGSLRYGQVKPRGQ